MYWKSFKKIIRVVDVILVIYVFPSMKKGEIIVSLVKMSG